MSETAITIPAPPDAAAKPWPGVRWWHEKSGFSFHDLLDAVNPLQHLPIVSTIYRSLTGDEPGALSRMVGDGLFGGLMGFASSVVNVLIKADTGKDIGEHVMSLLGLDGSGDKPAAATATATAAASPPTRTAAATTLARPAIPLSPSRYIMPSGAPAAPAQPTGASSSNPGASPSAPAGKADSAAEAGSSGSAAPTAVPVAAPLGPSLVQRPVPLRATGLLLPNVRPHSQGAPLPASAAGPAQTQVSGGAAPASSTNTDAAATADPNQPVEISQKMSEALDKYARLMQHRQGAPASGSQLNLVQ